MMYITVGTEVFNVVEMLDISTMILDKWELQLFIFGLELTWLKCPNEYQIEAAKQGGAWRWSLRWHMCSINFLIA